MGLPKPPLRRVIREGCPVCKSTTEKDLENQ